MRSLFRHYRISLGVYECGHQRLAALFALIICALIIAVGIRMSGIYYLAFSGIGLLLVEVMLLVFIVCYLLPIKGCVSRHRDGRIGLAITVLVVLALLL